MGAFLYKILDLFSNNFVRQMLTSFGVGLATGIPFYFFLSTQIDNAVAKMGSSPYVGLMALFGVDTALSIIFSAILTRAYWESMKLRAVKR